MTDVELSRLYPELAAGGRLAEAVRKQVQLMGSEVQVEDPLGHAYAIARANRRHCRVTVRLGERAFLADLWDRGVIYGTFSSPDLNRLALVIHTFLGLGAGTSELELLGPELDISPKGRAHERGTLVEFQWTQLLTARPAAWPQDRLHDAFAFAANRRFRQLMPFTSLGRACFSTRTGQPYTRDCPAIQVFRDGWCRVFLPDLMPRGEAAFTGGLEEAVLRAEALLPSDITAARDGTAEDDGG